MYFGPPVNLLLCIELSIVRYRGKRMARAVTIAIYKKVSLTFLIRHGTPSKRTSRPRVHAVKDTALACKAQDQECISS